MFGHLKAVWAFRHFWLALVSMDLRARYRKSVLGIAWSVMNPVLMSGALVLGLGGILGDNDYCGYGAYLLTGLCVWDFIRNSTVAGCSSLLQNESYIRQCPLPFAIYPLRTVLGIGIHFLISLVVMSVFSCILLSQAKGPDDGRAGGMRAAMMDQPESVPLSSRPEYYPTHQTIDGVTTYDYFRPIRMGWAILPVIPMLFIFCWGVATTTAFITPYFHDTKHLMEVGSQLFFFVTPIMTKMAQYEKPGLVEVQQYNPVYVFLRLIREPLLKGTPAPLELYLQGAFLALLAFGLGAAMISWLQKKVIFQL